MASLRVRLRLADGLLLATVFAALFLSAQAFSAQAFSADTNVANAEKPVEERCLKNHPVVSPKRFVLYSSVTLPLVLETSYRMSHILVTHVFRTFLVEVLGYDNVQVRYVHDNFTTHPILERLSEPGGDNATNYFPESMVNLEVWLRPDQDTMGLFHFHANNVYEAGTITNYGRFAWFSPDTTGRGFSGETWEIFTKLETSDKYSFTPSEESDFIKYTKDSDGTFYCKEKFCTDGMYVPERCHERRHGSSYRCALLFASYGNMTTFVHRHIDKLGLYVKVVWVGPNLAMLSKKLIEPRAKKNKALVFLGWSPSELVVQGEDSFHVISFPTCEEMASRNMTGCFYDLQRLVKIAWSHLGEAAPPAYEALRTISFEHSDYRKLLDLQENLFKKGLSKEDSIRNASCEWMKDNELRWKEWGGKPNQKPFLSIGGIFPLNSKSYKARGIAVAATLAQDAINQNDTVLRDYRIKLLVSDGQCKPDVVMKTFIDYIYTDTYPMLVGVLGPTCSDTVEPLAGVSTLYKTVVISYSAEGSTFPNRHKYPYFFRTVGENNQYNQVYLQLLQKIGWKQVASLSEDQRYTEYLSHLQDVLQTNGINFAFNRKFPRDWNATSVARYLEELKQKNAKIIIGDVYNEAARSLMCEAYLKNMTAQHGYVWFLPLWLSPGWYDTDNNNDNSTVHVRCSTADMIEAINGHLSLTHAYYADDDVVMQENVTVREWRDRYEEKCSKGNHSTHDYAGFAYDAVWTYALALDKLMKENQSHLVTIHKQATINRYVQVLSDSNFMGVSGRIKFNGKLSRVSIIRVAQWIKNETRYVGTYFPNSSYPDGPGRLDLNLSAIVWLTPDGKKPSDGTEEPNCFLSGLAYGLGISCEAALIVANVIGIVCLLIVSAVVFIVYKRRYDRKMKKMADTQKYMESLGLDLLYDSSDLHKWEIPRNLVVLNRKLGEGAFGTVYGGETEIEGKGWVAVAVKTLKVGSTTEEKLDFLVEAEVMKRLDHKNIVKLIGVCTRTEPVYAVMEFMLYGDLKTYLLARRHLVNSDKGGEESDEVSSKRLTSMALDVARALSYLAEIKFVHRDVASRNCLVNVSRMVKLGDFGMTRSLFEKDYYKFNKKAMLPVRWMSPESLSLGCFTPASDVWSYGVLLYEIITFGSFPFQGMTNAEVLEHVKQGHTLNIPTGVKAQLEGLIKSCWNLDYERRPKASEIVDFLANNPRLLQPYLDAPLSSVQMDDSSQMEITLSGGLRKSASNCYNRNHPRQPNADLLIDMQEHSAGGSTMDSTVCPTEPLLGSPRNNSVAAKGITKFVTGNLPVGRPTSKPIDEYHNSHDLEVTPAL